MKIQKKRLFPSHTEFVRQLALEGHRLFNMSTAQHIAQKLGVKPTYTKELLFHLKNEGLIRAIKRGLYALDSLFLDGHPLHEFEIAMALAPNSVISFYSAFKYHELTLQVPNIIYVTIPLPQVPPHLGGSNNSIINYIKYDFVRVKKDFYFGHKKIWLHNASITITDLERTLLDGLRKPHYCGSFIEVFNSYQSNASRIDLEKIIGYALKLELSTIKRLGYILELCNIPEETLQPLLDIPITSFCKLDNQGFLKGTYNKKWMILENI